ncbi:hypothetical protein DDW04_01180, partial [Sulfolobales archaeon SCGC AB-777_K09]
MDKATYDAVVVGAGLAGLMSAYYIAKEGFKVAVISKVFPTRSHSAAAEGVSKNEQYSGRGPRNCQE